MPDGRTIKQVDEDSYELTTYRGAPATQKEIESEVEKLRCAYKNMQPQFFAVLASMIAKEKWTAKRISDAVDNTLLNNQYPTLVIGNIMAFDKPKKLYNYSGYCNLITSKKAKHEDFGKYMLNGKCFWYLKNEQV